MYLVLRRDDQAPGGWRPITITAAETAEQAAQEGYLGSPCELAVVEWSPSIFTVSVEPTIAPKVEPDPEDGPEGEA